MNGTSITKSLFIPQAAHDGWPTWSFGTHAVTCRESYFEHATLYHNLLSLWLNARQ